MLHYLRLLLPFCIMSACTAKQQDHGYLKNSPLSEISNQIFLIEGTEKMASCPPDMYLEDTTNVNRVCIIFPNEKHSSSVDKYTEAYLGQLRNTKWSEQSKMGTVYLFTDPTDERSFKEKVRCVKMLSLAVWYDGETTMVDKAIKAGETSQFSNKILGLSLIGNQCE